MTERDAATKWKEQADSDRALKPRAVTLHPWEWTELANLVHGKVIELETDARAAATVRKQKALNYHADHWRRLFDRLVDDA